MGPTSRTVAWSKRGSFGMEFVDVALTPGRLSAAGIALGAGPLPYRLDYTLETDEGFVTSLFHVTARGSGWRRSLDLRRADNGTWSATVEVQGEGPLPLPGGDVAAFEDALDCDLGLSPLTNSMPVLRHDLLTGGGPVDFHMAWVSVPDLGVHPSGQRYTFLRHEAGLHVIRYENTDSTFTADLTFDDEGIVVDYPGLARRLP